VCLGPRVARKDFGVEGASLHGALHAVHIPEPLGTQATKQLVNLLTAPLEAYDVVSVLSLSSYPKLMDVLEHNTRKQMAVTIVRSVLKSGTIVQEVEQARSWQRHRESARLTIRLQVDMLFEFISLLIKDDEAFPEAVCVAGLA
jgi:hypothetical protein